MKIINLRRRLAALAASVALGGALILATPVPAAAGSNIPCDAWMVDGRTHLRFQNGYWFTDQHRTPANGACDTIRVFWRGWEYIDDCAQARVVTFNNNGTVRVVDTWRSVCLSQTVTLRSNVDPNRYYRVDVQHLAPWERDSADRPNFNVYVYNM